MSTPNEPTHMFKGTVSGEITTERKGDVDSDMILFFIFQRRTKQWLN